MTAATVCNRIDLTTRTSRIHVIIAATGKMTGRRTIFGDSAIRYIFTANFTIIGIAAITGKMTRRRTIFGDGSIGYIFTANRAIIGRIRIALVTTNPIAAGCTAIGGCTTSRGTTPYTIAASLSTRAGTLFGTIDAFAAFCRRFARHVIFTGFSG